MSRGEYALFAGLDASTDQPRIDSPMLIAVRFCPSSSWISRAIGEVGEGPPEAFEIITRGRGEIADGRDQFGVGVQRKSELDRSPDIDILDHAGNPRFVVDAQRP